ncbi:MAG: phosphonate C-P lyase system protein PhnH [Zoogloeaceae bacterium]|jgi:alpha-D-ribose 1-methylphosphonate 5-triphosphate synthase subunit PhnH|nr:phosphonate C-P lyase system protein PhnH [Zoogloeaceae bacterium]
MRPEIPEPLLEAGLDNPVMNSLRVFRVALKAMSEPGLANPLTTERAIASLAPATYMLLLSLLDANTPLWISPRLDHPALRANLVFHCNCPIVARRHAAAFAVLDPAEACDLQEFTVGEARRPDLSCTLIIQLPDLGSGTPMRWSGAGILRERQVSLPLAESFWAARAARNAFPLGLDIFFTAGQNLMGCPRTTRTTNAGIHASPLF